jgi:hypothetical protein
LGKTLEASMLKNLEAILQMNNIKKLPMSNAGKSIGPIIQVVF